MFRDELKLLTYRFKAQQLIDLIMRNRRAARRPVKHVKRKWQPEKVEVFCCVHLYRLIRTHTNEVRLK